MKDKEKQINRTDNFVGLRDTMSIPNNEQPISVSKFEDIKLTIPCKKELEEKQVEKKKIKEIAKIINERCEAELEQVHASSRGGKVIKTVETFLIAKDIYEQGYRKLPEDSVVLSREEYKQLLDNAIRVDMEYLERQLKQASKETAEKFADEIKAYIYDNDHLIEKVNNIAKEFGVEITIDDNCKYYDKANMRCNGAKCTPECYCNGHKSECTEYPETRKKFSCKIKE